ncbi:MAG: ComF family protein [Chromatiales bacterium]|nr:ComF family protein [Chromatiales bacterium]
MLIHRFKFQPRLDLAATLAGLMLLGRRPVFCASTTLVAIPISRQRMRERGFNQAWQLASLLALELGQPFHHRLIRRVSHRPAQSSLRTAAARKDNVSGQFSIHEAAPEDVVIVDDVLTSGSTTEEAARTLRSAGTQRVQIWCCARATLVAQS